MRQSRSAALIAGLPLVGYAVIVAAITAAAPARPAALFWRYLLPNGWLLLATLAARRRLSPPAGRPAGRPASVPSLALLLGVCSAAVALFAVFWPQSAAPPAPLAPTELLCLIAVVPAVEELYFRGLLLDQLRAAAGAAAAVAASSLLFGAIHLPAMGRLLPMTLVGAALAAARLHTGSLLPPIALHATLNALASAHQLPAADRSLPVALHLATLAGLMLLRLVWRGASAADGRITDAR